MVPPLKYPPTPLGTEALRGAGAKASEGYPPVAKSTEAPSFEHLNNPTTVYAFIHGQSPCSSAQVDKSTPEGDRFNLRISLHANLLMLIFI
jgi:hypothetical protein